MGLYSRGLIFEWFFCQQIVGLIFEGAYNRGGLYSRFYGMLLFTKIFKPKSERESEICLVVPHLPYARFSLYRRERNGSQEEDQTKSV